MRHGDGDMRRDGRGPDGWSDDLGADDQVELGASVLRPGVMAAVRLQQHPSLGHLGAAETALR